MLGLYKTENLIVCEIETVSDVKQTEDKNGNLSFTHTLQKRQLLFCEKNGDHVNILNKAKTSLSLSGYTHVDGTVLKVANIRELPKSLATKKYVSGSDILDMQYALNNKNILSKESETICK